MSCKNPKVTVAFISCGELAEKNCLAAIRNFRKQVELIEIRNVYPQIKALNQMIYMTHTEYLIPLDADIVLNNNAWTRISSAIEENQDDPSWHSILFPLWDTLTSRKILALKILRTNVLKKLPFVDVPTPDVEHYQRLTENGYKCIDLYLCEEPIGKHIVQGRHFCYFKYKDVYQTYRAHNFEWDSGAFMGGRDLQSKARNHFNFFFMQWVKTSNDDYLHCIAGMMDGILSPVANKSKTLEHKQYKIDSSAAIGKFFEWSQQQIKTHQSQLLF